MGEKESFSAENRVGAAEVVKRLLMDCGGERMVSRDLLREQVELTDHEGSMLLGARSPPRRLRKILAARPRDETRGLFGGCSVKHNDAGWIGGIGGRGARRSNE